MPICCHLVCAALHYSFQLDYDRYEVRLPVAWPYRLSTRLCWQTFLPVGRHTCPPNVYAHVHCRDRQRLSNIGLTCLIWKTILVSHCYRQCTAFSFCHTSRIYHLHGIIAARCTKVEGQAGLAQRVTPAPTFHTLFFSVALRYRQIPSRAVMTTDRCRCM